MMSFNCSGTQSFVFSSKQLYPVNSEFQTFILISSEEAQ